MRRKFRIRTSREFRRVYGGRVRRGGRLVVVHSRSNSVGHPRFGFSVSSKAGGAVVRNLLKRRLRSVADDLLTTASGSVDLVVVVRPEAAAASFAELSSEFRVLAGEVLTFEPADGPSFTTAD